MKQFMSNVGKIFVRKLLEIAHCNLFYILHPPTSYQMAPIRIETSYFSSKGRVWFLTVACLRNILLQFFGVDCISTFKGSQMKYIIV